MVKYTIQRLLMALLTCAIILSLTFFMIKSLPFELPTGTNDTVFAYLRDQVTKGYVVSYTSEQLQLGSYLYKYVDSTTGRDITYYFYLRPVLDQYIAWVTGIFTQFNWGQSQTIAPNVDSMVLIFGTNFWDSRLWTSVQINIWSVIVSVPLGIALGIWAALKKNKMTDHVISTLVMVFISVPSFIVITLFMWLFCYNLHWLPTQWYTGSDGLERFKSYIIPVVCLSFGSICGYCRFTRAELTEVMSSDFLLLARTKGLTKSQSITRHALKNAFVPILPSILAEIIGLLGGSMILESLYGIEGIGYLYVTAINRKDYNVLMADMSFYTMIGLLSGVFLDLSYGFIDPRIRVGAKK